MLRDEYAIRCKVLELINAYKIENVLSVIQSAQKGSFCFNFYKAYCFYRQNKLNEAFELLKKHVKTHPSILLENLSDDDIENEFASMENKAVLGIKAVVAFTTCEAQQ
ncbi:hypothetical protein V6N13_032257 [Hibiscus sabdariffa]|uniref:Uncharacterized protein n=2 Tax=Hibiscus sabdariffa TaxID=183260 RepID=A0ABR1ZSL8_9ROSI